MQRIFNSVVRAMNVIWQFLKSYCVMADYPEES